MYITYTFLSVVYIPLKNEEEYSNGNIGVEISTGLPQMHCADEEINLLCPQKAKIWLSGELGAVCGDVE